MRLREPHCPTAGRHLHAGHVAPNSRATHNAQAVRLANQRHGMPMHGAATVGEPQYPRFPCLFRLSHGAPQSR